ncbi:hypothetical protein [Paenibacillus sp. UNC451MF]|uniref:hypothetical protein n=1 Tax=Paenibacillus sp. UNC451MF TaxID=1449063 RepID=UPI00048E41DE|nr:hypothetical protein [Paenibacillus sp. UNC451MF]
MAHVFTIEPTTYIAFEDEAAQIEKCKEWGLLSEKASKNKAFFYKGNGMNLACSIIGYVDNMTAIIEFDNKQLHCIHPSYLKEMQAASYSQRLTAVTEEAAAPADTEPVKQQEEASQPAVDTEVITAEPEAEAAPKASELAKGKAKKQKLQLPEEKVKMTAVVKEFTTVPNHFSDNDDEVIIYEVVTLVDQDTEVGDAWSSHSATLKKLELEVGDKLTFEGKIVAKKLTKHPVPYKINNPAKLQKV